LLAAALHSEEVNTPRLNRPPRGPFVREAEFVRGAYLHQYSLSGQRLSQRHFALKMLKVSMTIWNKWVDGMGAMRTDNVEKVAKYAPPGLPRPLAAVYENATVALETGQAYAPPSEKLARGYMVKTNEGALLARAIDRITDDMEREKALSACLRELQGNPRGVVAEQRPDRPTQST
jgi:hypothetical protein